jgi:tetrahydrodipicolinate N-succinyltransferase
MTKKYDIVNTSKMSAEYDGSLIFTEYDANGALENGRLCAIVSDKAQYAVTEDAKVYLHASVEKMYDTILGLTEFRVEDGSKVRLFGMRAGDEFATTAFDGVAVKGDKVIVGANGTLVKGTPVGTENFIAEVLAVTTLGYDKTSAIKVRVIKA